MADIEVIKHAPREGEMLFHPIAKVELTTYSCDERGRIILGPDLMSPTEIDCWADRMIGEIEQARKSAKHHMATARGSFYSTT